MAKMRCVYSVFLRNLTKLQKEQRKNERKILCADRYVSENEKNMDFDDDRTFGLGTCILRV